MTEQTNEVKEDVSDNPNTLTTTSNEPKSVIKASNNLTSQEIGCAINHLNLLDEKQVTIAEAFITRIMRSEKGGVKTVADGLAVLMRAQDLEIPFGTAIEHIHVINGKTGIDVHIAKALLSKAACTWECIKDYQALYEYTDGINVYCDGQLPDYCIKCISKSEAETKRKANEDGDEVYIYPVKFYSDFMSNKYKDYQLNPKTHKIVSTKQEAIALQQQKIIGIYRIPAIPIDYVTEYKFTRKYGDRIVTATSHFSYTEAVQAGFFEKDTYVKYCRIMISHRAFFLGARDIASDKLLGASETMELKLVNNIPLSPQDVSYEEI